MVTLSEFLTLSEDKSLGVEICQKDIVPAKGLFGQEKRKASVSVIQKRLPINQILQNSNALLLRKVDSFSLVPIPLSIVVYLSPKD